MELSNLTIKTDKTAEFRELFATATKRALEAIGLTAEGYAKENITNNGNIDTGNLRNSITHIVKDNEVYIGTDVEYGAYVECGTGVYYPGGRQGGWAYYDDNGVRHFTYGSKPYPFLKPAAEEHAEEYHKLLKASYLA